ncbi:hypothetical protein BBO99_00008795 [Phytophthora kernoviae]|uniref:Autophagy protein 5 n=2 Tax=Phytophthora kernoviae TaxID=325452 RepID=A0A421GEH5_9STRA|nr:hypothetical protein G195_009885 [Phytophthora kernoviae 00238/432]KAG2509795.1 hypothetical protein JM16_008646 [Phytophthora kernoviae]KAG2511559.1 hypothetical protein JM18_008567 [Phytophthora kernoviae]RLN11145.1 hypothetical protein BBI17_008816 [Phytophthora kernoviae]RLN74683.1 hypothetical protein BBO99_00008795 [Phytophthora kernoviae]
MSIDAGSEALLRQRIWAGRIPVMFSLDPSEVTTLHAPHDYESYREATHELQLDGGVEISALRHLPLRVHLDDAPAIQMPIAPLQEGREKTLQEVLYYLLPDLFPSDSVSDTQTHNFQLVVHGIPVPPEVSIVALYRSFAYADGFLYVAVLSQES